jgi:hypothetical protein
MFCSVETSYLKNMFEEKKYLDIVSETKADITPFIDLAISENQFRDVLTKHLLHNNAINIYYHSYMIIHKAIRINPSLFFCYWNEFSSLLKYDNSYHRNYGMDLIANLAALDKNDQFKLIIEDFYKQLYDKKISTIKYCISYSEIIVKSKPQLASTIIRKIIGSLRVNDNSDRYQNFLINGFLKFLTSIDKELPDKTEVKSFLKDVLISTKSVKIKKEINKYFIQN